MRKLLLVMLLLLPVLAEDKRDICIRHFERSRMGGQLLASISNLKNIATAAEMYEADKGQLPTSLQQLTPQYLRTIPTNPANGKSYDYKRVDATHYLITTQGDAFKPMGVPANYPRYEGVIEPTPDFKKMTSAQSQAYLARLEAERKNPQPQPVYWKPGQLVPKRSTSRNNDLLMQATTELTTASVSGDYSKALGLYKRALQAGGLYPWEESEIRQFLKEMGDK